jgi:Family of unknown function (DUF5683)
MRKYFIFLFLLVFIVKVQAQQPENTTKRRGGAIPVSSDTARFALPSVLDSNSVKLAVLDTNKTTIDTAIAIKIDKHPIRDFIRKDYPNPKKAALFSILPGGGQIYNKSYWKLPLLYGGIVGMTILMTKNNAQYKSFKAGYFAKVNDMPDTELRFKDVDAITVKSARDSARKNLELSGVIFALGYLLFSAEAFVDAHLGTFDVSDDLSLKLKPQLIPNFDGSNSAGLGIAFHFH